MRLIYGRLLFIVLPGLLESGEEDFAPFPLVSRAEKTLTTVAKLFIILNAGENTSRIVKRSVFYGRC
jgi:hypothetical protein